MAEIFLKFCKKVPSLKLMALLNFAVAIYSWGILTANFGLMRITKFIDKSR
jgi:hypothetical protein